MKVNWRAEIPLIALIAGMWVAAALMWPSSPDRYPVRWELSGEVDRYGDRIEGLLVVPAIGFLTYLLMLFLPRLDPGRLNYAKFAGAWYTIRASSLALLAFLYAMMVLSARGVPIDVPRFTGLAMGATFFVMGNVMGKLRPNWFFGVRTPWTLSSKLSWSKTHRLAGWVFVAGGLALMAAGLIGTPAAMGVAIAILMAGVLGAVAYSYFVWRSDPDRVPPAGTLPTNDEGPDGMHPR